ncbi:hypothetical protein TI03_06880, partial [Achromatium sp. WMS1]
MWQAFRAACDQVFDKRREAQQLQQEVIETKIKSLNAICETLENLAKTSGSQNLTTQFEELKANWKTSLEEFNLSHQEEVRLQKRWKRGVDAMHRRVRLLEEAAQRSQMERLRMQAALCNELEMLVAQTGESAVVPLMDDIVTDWRTRWDNLSKNKDPIWRDALEKRFAEALAAAQDPKLQEE